MPVDMVRGGGSYGFAKSFEANHKLEFILFSQGFEMNEEELCGKLRDELLDLKFVEKNNDLYQFRQVNHDSSAFKGNYQVEI